MERTRLIHAWSWVFRSNGWRRSRLGGVVRRPDAFGRSGLLRVDAPSLCRRRPDASRLAWVGMRAGRPSLYFLYARRPRLAALGRIARSVGASRSRVG